MNLGILRARAAKNELEVEDILESAVKRISGLDIALEALIDECAWTDGGPLPSGGIEIPFRRWALTAIHFYRGGIPALHTLARDQSFLPFVLALLEALHTTEAVEAVVAIAPEVFADPASDLETARRITSALNLMLSFPPQIIVTEPTSRRIRDFLHTSIPLCNTDAHLATAILALRGIGGHESLDLIRSLPPLQPPWSDVSNMAVKAIRSRLRKS